MYPSRINRRHSLSRRNDFDKLFNQFFNGGLNEFVGTDFVTNVPAVNVLEDADNFKLQLAAPGLSKEDFHINLENDRLTIEASKENSTEETGETYRRREYNYETFKRSFKLPEGVKTSDIGANYDNGVLTVTLPKKEEAKEVTKTIEIS